MDYSILAPISVALLLGIIALAASSYVIHGEYFRPLLGAILRRRPMVPFRERGLTFFEQVAKRRLKGEWDLLHLYAQIDLIVRRHSWFKQTDLDTLEHLYKVARVELLTRQRMDELFENLKKERHTKPPAGASKGWRSVLGLSANETNAAVIKRAYRLLASQHHPDKGGDANIMAAAADAYKDAKQELGFK